MAQVTDFSCPLRQDPFSVVRLQRKTLTRENTKNIKCLQLVLVTGPEPLALAWLLTPVSFGQDPSYSLPPETFPPHCNFWIKVPRPLSFAVCRPPEGNGKAVTLTQCRFCFLGVGLSPLPQPGGACLLRSTLNINHCNTCIESHTSSFFQTDMK